MAGAVQFGFLFMTTDDGVKGRYESGVWLDIVELAGFYQGSDDSPDFGTGTRSHHPDGPKADHVLTFKMDQSMGTDHD